MIQDLVGLDLEQLGQIRITSVSRRPESIAQATAAVTVISHDEIRRSGASNLAEVLQLVPGLQVARVSTREWAITARGFTESSPNKLLVLIDGRAIYSHLFAGVFWELQEIPLEQIDRIEVILGPGATLWGSNAVNGVINVTTRTATQTLGARVGVRAGTNDRLKAGGRYGVPLGSRGGVRVYLQHDNRGPSHLPDGGRGRDRWRQTQAGFRLDLGSTGTSSYTVQGDIYTGTGGQRAVRFSPGPPYSEVVNDELTVNGGNLLARYIRRIGGASELRLQTYYDRSFRRVSASFGSVAVSVFDVEAQYTWALAARHQLMWGAGYRINTDSLSGTFTLMLNPRSRTTHLLTAFAQDEIALARDRWYLTLGAKLEHNAYSGIEMQPNLRLRWSPNPHHTVWSAVSRSVRTPSRIDTDLRAVSSVAPGMPPTVVEFFGNPDFEPEALIAYEVGYRGRLSRKVSADLALYYNDYDRLRTILPLPARSDTGGFTSVPIILRNDGEGHSHGGTAVVSWQPHHRVLVRGSYTHLQSDVALSDGAPSGAANTITPGLNPRHMARLAGSFTLPGGLYLDLALRFMGELPSPPIQDYLEADARLAWAFRPNGTLALIGRNLVAAQHAEFPSALNREIQRSAHLQFEWLF